MKKGKSAAIFIVISLSILAACTARQVPTEPSEGQAPVVREKEQVIAKENWEVKWEKILQLAKKEGKVRIYTSSPAAALKELSFSLERKYGLTLDIISGRGAEIRARLFQERAHGLYLADIVMAGLSTTFGAIKKAGMLEPIEPLLMLPEVIDPKMWYGGKLPFLDEARMVVGYVYYPRPMLAINSELVRPEQVKSYHDLLNPKWKGKIIINDPTVTGAGFNGFNTLIYNKTLDQDFFHRLVKEQKPEMIRDQRLQATWLARGKYLILLWPRSVEMETLQKAGAPIVIVDPKEGTSLSSHALTMVNRAANPEAARIFINWILTKEPQNVLQNAMGYQSSRLDVPTEGLDPVQIRKPGVKYLIGPDTIEDWVINEQENYLELAKQVFGPLVGK